MEFGDSSGGAGSDYLNFVQQFPSAKRAFDTAGERRTAYDVGEHFWGVLRDQECVGVLDDAGVLHAKAGPIDLMSVYKKRRRLDDVVLVVSFGSPSGVRRRRVAA